MDEAEGGQLALSMLGSAVQSRAPIDFRTELNGKMCSISKYMKARFGGWEAFVQAHAEGKLCVAAGSVRRAAPPADDMPAEPDAGAQLRHRRRNLIIPLCLAGVQSAGDYLGRHCDRED